MASKIAQILLFRRNMLNYSTYKAVRAFSLSTCSRTNRNTAEHVENGSNKTHFGYQTVDEAEKQQKVNEVFGNVAEKYDIMNDAMSGGVHRLWKDYFMEKLAPQPGTQLIDVAGGTGDIAFRFLKFVENEESLRMSQSGARFNIDIATEFPELGHYNETSSESDSSGSGSSDDEREVKDTHVTVCDINPAMLEVGQRRAEELGYYKGMTWMEGNAENLEAVESNSYDAYTIAFGIRNCTHIDKVLEEAYRVLKPGGRFMCLEFSHVPNPALRWLYDQYSFQVIPPMGQIIAADWHSYQYLVESIRRFPNQDEFSAMIRDAGFKAVRHENLFFGVSAIHSGFKF